MDFVLGWSLDDAAMKEIDRILAETIKDPVGPEFMAPPLRTTSGSREARTKKSA